MYTDKNGNMWLSKKIYLSWVKSQKNANKRKKEREKKKPKEDSPSACFTSHYKRISRMCERCETRKAVVVTWNNKIVCQPCHFSLLDEYDSII